MIAAVLPALAVGIVLGLLGAGGSILTVPILVYLVGMEPRSAVIGSLVVVGLASCSGALQHRRAGRVRLRPALTFASASIPAAFLGAYVSRTMPSPLLLRLFAAVMISSATAMLSRREDLKPPPPVAPLKLLSVGGVVGIVTGVVGAGGGFLIVPALVLFAGVPMTHAVGTSLVTITLNCAAGLVGKWGAAPVDWRLILSFSGVAIAGSFIGLALSRRLSAQQLRHGFAFLVLAIAMVLLIRN